MRKSNIIDFNFYKNYRVIFFLEYDELDFTFGVSKNPGTALEDDGTEATPHSMRTNRGCSTAAQTKPSLCLVEPLSDAPSEGSPF
jgi:hypothetical protein